jgi:poly-beta-1,6-N-acetyl-D-glucosamine synthase
MCADWQACFLVCALGVVYPYLIYPLILAALAAVNRRPVQRRRQPLPSISIIVCARDEEAAIRRRLDELTALLKTTGGEGEILVIDDGSTDLTAAIVRAYPSDLVRLIELYDHQGKAAALSRGCAAAYYDVLVFADVRQSWARNALRLLVENFADPEVGAVSGDLIVEAPHTGAPNDVSLYWRYEKLIRQLESGIGSSVSVTGCMSAVRRTLFRPIPQGTVLDDVYWPLQVVMQGYRVIHDPRAHAYDYLPESQLGEFRRKLRTLSGNFQLLCRLPAALLPWRNPVWFQFLSHKVARLVAPWALLGTLIATAALMDVPFYYAAFWIQAACYLLAIAGLSKAVRARVRLASVAASFLLLNAAAWLAFWMWLCGRATKTWRKVQYVPIGHAPSEFPGEEMPTLVHQAAAGRRALLGKSLLH